MGLFSGRASMLEVQNRALIKTAQERAQRISNLERELQQAGREVERLKAEAERLKVEAERVKVEREFYHKRVLALEQNNHELTEAATKYSLWGQNNGCCDASAPSGAAFRLSAAPLPPKPAIACTS